jgi:hypothetical protein
MNRSGFLRTTGDRGFLGKTTKDGHSKGVFIDVFRTSVSTML